MDKQMTVQTDRHIVTLASHVNSRGQAEWKLWDSHESAVSFPDSHARWPDGRSAGPSTSQGSLPSLLEV